MSHGWYPPTYADAQGLPRTQVVKCPKCRRRVPAEMLYDLRQHAVGDHHFLCDACLAALYRAGHLTPAQFVAQAGAPSAIVEKLDRAWKDRAARIAARRKR